MNFISKNTLLIFFLTVLAFKTSAQHSVFDFLEKGRNFQDEEKWEQAVEQYSHAINADKNLPNAFFNRAICFLQLQQFHSAKKDLNVILKEESSDLEALSMRAFIEFNQKNWLAAAQDYSMVLKIEKDNFDARLNRAIIYLKMGEPGAFQDLKMCAAIAPDNLKLNAVFGDYYLSKNDFLNALSHYNFVLRRDEKNAEVLNNCGTLEMRRENYHQAIEYFQKSLAVKSTGEVYAHLALAQIKVDDFINATENTEKALSLTPNEGVAHFVQGRLHDKNGNPKRAIESFSRAIELNKDYMPAFLQRGKVYIALDKLEEAASDLKKVTELTPENKEAAELLKLINQ